MNLTDHCSSSKEVHGKLQSSRPSLMDVIYSWSKTQSTDVVLFFGDLKGKVPLRHSRKSTPGINLLLLLEM
ncbi:unnamed protein product [Eruca vesicaria subsp. sativa]|uniref:Uncharacterized protein n=1 Tax=Eruca vesicaria subsp. sativa TaxID=29727 RepID=A0ABC8K7S5_ERUVS|nr:unnamed protein product [Eruca vesicaria subsp. sativa]